jgi:PAS domain S-box-containing protein
MIKNVQERLEFLSAVLGSINEGVIACDADGVLVYFNPKAVEMHGLSHLDIPYDKWAESYKLFKNDGITPLRYEEIPLYRAYQNERVQNAEMIVAQEGQAHLLLLVNAQPLFDSEGNKIGAMATMQDITESRKSNERIHTRFLAVFEQSPLSIQICSRDGRTLLVNKAWQKLWSISDEFIREYILKDYNILEDKILEANGQLEKIHQGFKGHVMSLSEFLYDPATVGQPGRARWTSGLIYPLKNKRGEVLEVVIIHQDLTAEEISKKERDKLLSQLKYERNMLEAILQQLPAGIMVADAEGKITLTNERFQKMQSQNPKIFRADNSEYQPGELPIYRSLTGAIILEEEQRLLFPNGTTATLSASSAPIQDSEGRIAAAAVITSDITDKKREEEIQRFLDEVKSILLSTLDYDKITENVAISSIPFLADGCILDLIEGDEIKRIVTKHKDPHVENLMRKLLKYPPTTSSNQPTAKVIKEGKPLFILLADQNLVNAHTINEEHASLVESIGIRSYIAVPLKIRGRTIGAINFMITTDRPLFDERDLSTAMDLGHHAALVIEKAKLYRDAQSAIKLRDDFISIASHELKTPLTALILQIEVLMTIMESVSTEESETVMRVLNSTNRQLDRLTRLVEDMLDISRIASGKMKISRKKVDIVEVTREVLDRFKEQLALQQTTLQFSSPQFITINCDPYRIEQVITNLMTNAIRYGEKSPIQVSIHQEKDIILIKVADQGRGISKGDHERIFNRFERAVDADDIIGLGLGLYINKQIVEEHGGKIYVESELNHGATFILELPMA